MGCLKFTKVAFLYNLQCLCSGLFSFCNEVDNFFPISFEKVAVTRNLCVGLDFQMILLYVGHTIETHQITFQNVQTIWVHPNIKFKLEVEGNNCSPFLDLLIYSNNKGNLRYNLKKATHTNIYLHTTIYIQSRISKTCNFSELCKRLQYTAETSQIV